jgi:hypothetical protein|tara:strand:+ start:9 stop:620 length:612 start_codon:yes stop_codon:yes gene_type:complete
MKLLIENWRQYLSESLAGIESRAIRARNKADDEARARGEEPDPNRDVADYLFEKCGGGGADDLLRCILWAAKMPRHKGGYNCISEDEYDKAKTTIGDHWTKEGDYQYLVLQPYEEGESGDRGPLDPEMQKTKCEAFKEKYDEFILQLNGQKEPNKPEGEPEAPEKKSWLQRAKGAIGLEENRKLTKAGLKQLIREELSKELNK